MVGPVSYKSSLELNSMIAQRMHVACYSAFTHRIKVFPSYVDRQGQDSESW